MGALGLVNWLVGWMVYGCLARVRSVHDSQALATARRVSVVMCNC